MSKFARVVMLAAVLGNAAFVAYMFPRMPEVVPVHWGIDGQPDRWGSRWENALLAGLMPLVIGGLMLGLTRLRAVHASVSRFADAYDAIAIAIVLAVSTAGVVVTLKTVGAGFDIGAVLLATIGLMLSVVGNYFGKLRRNPWVGIRLPWTLASDVVWERTHRLGGRLFVAAGVLPVVSLLVAPPWVGLILLVTGALAATVWSGVYAYRVHARVTGGEAHA